MGPASPALAGRLLTTKHLGAPLKPGPKQVHPPQGSFTVEILSDFGLEETWEPS